VTPIAHFDDVWHRCVHLTAVQGFVASNATQALNADELLRAEWVARISALDLYVHELVCQGMVDVFEGRRSPTPQYQTFQISNDTVERIRKASTQLDRTAAFDLEIRTKLSSITYQQPESIADGVRLFSTVELWNEVAVALGATPAAKNTNAKALKRDLARLVERRNKIAHEGDLQPSAPRQPWPISQADLRIVTQTIESIVRAIDSVV